MWQLIKRHRLSILLFVLLLLGVVLRLVRLEELFHFTYDEEIIAFVGKRMWVNHHIPLIGGVTPMHVHLAPYFYWLSGIILGFSKLNPLGWGVAAAFISLFTMLILFVTARKMFGIVTAYFSVTLYAFSFFQNIFDRHYWGLAINGLLTVSTIYCVYKLTKGERKSAYILAFILAFGFHTDPSTLVLIILVVLSLAVLKIKLEAKIILACVGIFLLSFLPLVVFDLRHDFSNSRGIIQYIDEFKQPKANASYLSPLDAILFVPRALARTIYVSGETDLAKQYSYCTQHTETRLNEVSLIAIAVVLMVFVFLLKTKKNRNEVNIILLLLFSVYIGVTVYGLVFRGALYDHYISTIFPVFLLALGLLLSRIWMRQKLVAIAILIIFIFFNLQLLANATHRFGFKDKSDAVRWAISETGSQDISLDVISSCFRFNGYRYLFYLYGKEPAKSYVDANFTHLFDIPPKEEHPDLLVVITNPDFEEQADYFEEYNQYKSRLIKSKKFGEIEVLLVDNKDKRFVGKY